MRLNDEDERGGIAQDPIAGGFRYTFPIAARSNLRLAYVELPVKRQYIAFPVEILLTFIPELLDGVVLSYGMLAVIQSFHLMVSRGLQCS